MTKQYTQDELWKLFDTLPEELKQAVFSPENADHIFNICDRYNIEQMPKIAYYAGLVLMGIIPAADFESILKKEIGLEEEKAQTVAREVNRFIFYPAKPAIEQLQKTAEASAKQTKQGTISAAPSQPIAKEKTTQEEDIAQKPKAPDSYREPLE
ncbi:MAG: hypothetical protein HYW95_02530 [Candidatus Wildermuthbacteria bacterium]|nr:hypothetical protein [Candidatus Wildermuthbacteria bacterium]